MKRSILIKLILVAPLLFFGTYIIMTVVGCFAALLGSGDPFYCGTYCILGNVLLMLSGLYLAYLIMTDLAASTKLSKNGPSEEE